MLGILAPQLEGSMDPGRGHNSSKKAQQEPDYAVAGYPVTKDPGRAHPVLQRPVSQAPGPPDQQGTM